MLCNVAHVPEIQYNLFSLAPLLGKGHGVTGGQTITAVEEVDVIREMW